MWVQVQDFNQTNVGMDQTITILNPTSVLETIFQVVSILSIGVLCWYTYETFRIRRVSENQNLTMIRPHLAYTMDSTNFTVRNTTNNTALNIVLLTKLNGQLQVLKDVAHLSAVAPQQTATIQRSNMEAVTTSGLKQRMPDWAKLFNYIALKETQCLVILYEDLSGSKLYTLHYGSGDLFGVAGETGYVKDLRI